MPRISLDSIHMLENDPSGRCASVDSTASFAIYQFTVSSCGTRMKVGINRGRAFEHVINHGGERAWHCCITVLVYPMVTIICPPLCPSGRKRFCYLWEHDVIRIWSGRWTSWINFEGQFLWVRRLICFYAEVFGYNQWKVAQYFLSVSWRLKFQCRYSGSAVEALVVEVNTVPPPPPVSQNGPLRVELRLASGQCSTKGCSDGEQNPEMQISQQNQ